MGNLTNEGIYRYQASPPRTGVVASKVVGKTQKQGRGGGTKMRQLRLPLEVQYPNKSKQASNPVFKMLLKRESILLAFAEGFLLK